MPDGVFPVSVLTPEERLLEVAARALVLRSSDGDLTVLDGHTPLITDVVPGDVRVDPEEGDPVHLAVHGGFLHVETGPGIGDDPGARATRATLLAGVAELASSIDVDRARRAREEASARTEQLRGARSGEEGADPELVEAEAALRRAEVRLTVAGEAP
jgi:F-type H+-transporting ATPase subunit epsilon